MTEFGYAGEILKVDLSDGNINRLSTADYADRFLGGRGIATKIYWDMVHPQTRVFDPENCLIYMTGPVTGFTRLAGGCRWQVCGKSAIMESEAFSYANLGDRWGTWLKYAGYDGLVVQGKADKSVYLFIHDGTVEIKDASHLWGKSTFQTFDSLKAELGKGVSVLAIGPAAENMVIFATMLADGGASGASGLGAVMGSKRLKAVVVAGDKRPRAADPQRLRQLADRILTLRKDTWKNWLFDIPGRTKPRACYGCTSGCFRKSYEAEGGRRFKFFCQAADIYRRPAMKYSEEWTEASLLAMRLCDKYGLDTTVMQPMIDWLDSCYQERALRDEDIGAGWKELTRGFAALPKYRYDRATGKYIPIEPDLSLLKTIPEAWAVQATPPGEYSYEYPPVYGTYPESSPEGRQAVISAWEEETGKSWAEEKLRWEGTTLGPDAIPREILQWYTRTHPQYPEEAITAYAQRTIDEEPVNLPEDYESRSEAAKLYWLANNAYDVAIFDRFGRLLSKEEALYSARTEPGEVVTVGYFMGGDLVVVDPRPLSEAVQSLPTFMGREAQEREAQREEALSEATVALGVEEGEKNVEFEDKRAALLDNKDLDYHNMVARLNELVMSTFPPGPLWGTWQQKNREDAYNAQSPEQQKAWDEEHKFDQYADIIPSKPRPERPKPEPLDIGKLQESLATYGAGTTDNYPYISPMPESQLMRIPPETLELMARYLSEKGLSWREWLTISSEFYGGGGGGVRGRWAIPSQWGR